VTDKENSAIMIDTPGSSHFLAENPLYLRFF